MTLRQFRIFQAVATNLSITKATRDIQITQPSLSRQLKLLEQELGVQLHARKEQGIKLTEEGQLFLDAIEPILKQIDDVKKLFATKAADIKPAFLRVAGSQSPSALMLPQAFKNFKKSHPHVKLTLRSADCAILERMVLNREVELGVIAHPCSSPMLTAEPLRSEEVMAIVSSKHPLAKRSKLTREELSKIPVVAKVGGRILRQLQKTGLQLKVAMLCAPIDAIKAAVESGLGMGFFYRSIVETALKEGYLKAINIPELKKVEANWFVIYLRDVPLSPETQDILDLLHQMASNSIRGRALA